ncbi:hypothetical protein ASE64_04900 [Agreia sp. Leaf210]|nr:hypothetical protein ASE64_04900 [Agreia sp. Leaf210]
MPRLAELEALENGALQRGVARQFVEAAQVSGAEHEVQRVGVAVARVTDRREAAHERSHVALGRDAVEQKRVEHP